MPRSGMTGFARLSGQAGWGQWTWEARSVNGRNLDLRLNLPSGFEALESEIRKRAATYFGRGNMQISLRIQQAETGQQVEIQGAVLDALIAAHEARLGAPVSPEALATLMTVKGVVSQDTQKTDDASQAEALKDCKLAIDELFEALRSARRDEGAKLQSLMSGHLHEIARLQQAALSYAQEQTEAIRRRFKDRLHEMNLDAALSDERFAAEVAALAAKADVTEELDRLKSHIERGEELLRLDEPVGRDLGFLAQELNREANTLCSKSALLDLTNTGLALKSVIDQFKEQAANVE